MDINDLRAFFTVVTFLLFIAIVWWAFSSHRKKAWDEASLLPLDDDLPVVDGEKKAADVDKLKG